jgi:16S rRNA (guanine527-N7)-methyltransferase
VRAALDALASGAASILARPLTGGELESFGKYLKLIQKWQKAQRLVGSTEPQWIVDNLFLDSLLFVRALPPRVTSLADVGSGAGLPGIPLKIARPDIRVSLIESRAKRASFLSAVIRELGLRDIEVLADRVEELVVVRRQAFDAAVMRCAGDFARVSRIAAELVMPGGLVIASGPPKNRKLELGEWVEVPGQQPESSRRFAVYRVP